MAGLAGTGAVARPLRCLPLDCGVRRRRKAEDVEEPPSNPAELRGWIAAHPGYDWHAAVLRDSPDLPWPAPGEPWHEAPREG